MSSLPDRPLPYGRQWVIEEDVEAVAEVLRSDYLTTGPLVGRFEKQLATVTGAGHAVAVNSGTAALHTAYFAAGLEPGDEIVTTPLTFAATANAALYLGATVRFVDVEADTGNLDPAQLEGTLTEHTRLIVPIDYSGHPADYDAIREIAQRHGVAIVADAAHSLGATYHGRKVGTLADLSTTSFHPVKPITTCEGGAVLTSCNSHAERCSRFRDHGIDRADRSDDDGPWMYRMRDLGFNYRLSDVHCALGLSQLARLESLLARRRQIASRYSEAFRELPGLTLPAERQGVRSAWHLYVVQVVEAKRRRSLFDRLKDLGLGVQVHYIPVHYHPYYQALGYEKGLCKVAEDRYRRSISLPIFPAMTDDDIDSVIARVHHAARDVL
jgi:UDP-4-amino-4,6-dideoxy-N-acetyl-beta-L-altrosamine transaminase